MENSDGAACCAVCYTTRPGLYKLECTWEWRAADRWIPYDLAAAREIEIAHAEDHKSVRLTTGWFSEQRATYAVNFNARGPHKHVQVNRATGMRRMVRRVGIDDETLFVPVAWDSLQADDKCGVCQFELEPDEEAPEHPVRLSACAPGHAFHRACLSQWFRLKGECPYCRARAEP